MIFKSKTYSLIGWSKDYPYHQFWYKIDDRGNAVSHREGNHPSYIFDNGFQVWYLDDKYIRDNGSEMG